MSWRSLDQVYLQESAGKSVGKLPRQRVLGEELYNVKYKKESQPEYTDLNVDSEQFEKAYRYLNTPGSSIKKVIESLQLSGLTAIQVKEVIEVVYRYDEPDKFFAALENKMPMKEFLSAPGNNIVDLVSSKYGLDKDLVGDLLMFAPTTQPVTGRCETFIILFVEGARKGTAGGDIELADDESDIELADTEGDIEIGKTQYEIKGSGARLKGQKGFGSQPAALRTFTNGVQQLITKSGLQLDFKNPDFDVLVRTNGFIDQIANELVATGNVTKQDIAQLYANGYAELYTNADNQADLLSWIEPNLDENGNIGDKFREAYFLFAAKYYADQEDFDYILFIGTERIKKPKDFGKLQYISAADVKNKSTSIFSKVVRGYPSTKPSAGPQGSFFSVKPQ
jgi:hypothetical protein